MAAVIDCARWSTEEIRALINIWENQEMQQKFDGTVRDSEVYKKDCDGLKKIGYARTIPQICSKIKALKAFSMLI
ncbi:hypothetical protein TNCV_650211 [Trichonephila clavipes]|nr:hypothetical protein TNCV_650211 [Trichonephila clavipes]